MGRGASRAGARFVIVSAVALGLSAPAAHATTTTYSTPGNHDFVVPAGVTELSIQLQGGLGSAAPGIDPSEFSAAGTVAYTLQVTPGETLRVTVGGGANGAAGGYNGGGAGGAGDGSYRGGGGGGATDIRRGGTALEHRVLVAGGGGGAGGFWGNPGGHGGNPTGQTGWGGSGGAGATQSGPGAGGSSNGLPGTSDTGGAGGGQFGGGGGGGYYGGGGGATSGNDGHGGGGGSSYGPSGTTYGTSDSQFDGEASLVYGPAAPTIEFTPGSPANHNDPTVKGTVAAGITVRLYDNADCSGTPLHTATREEYATGWSYHVDDDTSTPFSAIAIDSEGLESSCSAPVHYVEDSTPPSITVHTASVSPGTVGTVNTVSVTAFVTGAPVLELHTTSDCSGTPVYTGPQVHNVPVTVPDDSFTPFHFRGRDLAGNPSACSAQAASYEEDSTPPPAVADLEFVEPTSPDELASLRGTAAPGTTAWLFKSGDCSGPMSTFSYTPSELAAGVEHRGAADVPETWTVMLRDAAGHWSPCSNAATYTNDTIAPSAPDGLEVTPGPVGTDASPKLRGTAEAGSTLRLFSSDDCSGTAVATGSAADFGGAGIGAPARSDQVTTYTATAADKRGNVSGCSAPVTYRHDGTAPAVTLTGPASGSSSDDATPAFNGTAATAEGDLDPTVRLYTGDSAAGDPVATLEGARGSGGTYSVEADRALAPGRYTARATQADTVGNAGASEAVTFTVTAPATPAPPSGSGGPPPPAPPASPLPEPALAKLTISTRRATLQRSRLKITLACSNGSGSPCAGVLQLRMRSGGKNATVGRASYRVGERRRTTVEVKPTRTLLRLLRQKRRATVTAVAKPAGAGATAERRITVVLPR